LLKALEHERLGMVSPWEGEKFFQPRKREEEGGRRIAGKRKEVSQSCIQT
jgi:hypothetical protein